MGRFILGVFALLPLIEIAGFVLVGQAIGVWGTLLWVVLAAVLGVVLLRRQGLSVVNRLRQTMSGGELPGQAVLDAMLIGAAGFLLLLPGFFSDAIALLLLLPPVRGLIYRFARSRVTVVTTHAGRPARPTDAPQTLELDNDEWRPR
jgi:UPF0716 protein FxsA